jgi:putative ABC transport system ATP-binding protein
LNVLGLLDPPTSGSYELDNQETSEQSPREITRLRAETIGFVFQQFHLLSSKTVLENVALSGLYTWVARDVRLQRAAFALSETGLDQRASFRPNQLSGGEKQRVAIARAIASDPKLLLCDEPTGNLDSNTASEIEDLLHSMNRSGQTVVVVTHNEEFASRAQRIIHVRDGVVYED